MLHQDNISSSTVKFTVKFFEHVKVMEHPSYFLDVVMCDFLLIFNNNNNNNLKKTHARRSYSEIDEAIKEHFSWIQRNEWVEAFIRLQKPINVGVLSV